MRQILQTTLTVAAVVAVGWTLGRTENDPTDVMSMRVVESDVYAAVQIQGAWIASEYLLADGDIHPLRGRIFFMDGEWTVVFFVLDDEGRARRASAEGGTYVVADGVVTFSHEYNFSEGAEVAGLPASPLRMEVNARGSEPEEPTRFSIDELGLTLFFPSGNRMVFLRP